jgi:hypothetical protein
MDDAARQALWPGHPLRTAFSGLSLLMAMTACSDPPPPVQEPPARVHASARQLAWETEAAAGRRWAEAHRPQRISACRGDTPHTVLGCLRWLQEQPGAPRRWPYGATTTAECRTEVDANFRVSTQLDGLAGNAHAAASTRSRHWGPELQQCDQIDRKWQDPLMAEAYARLNQLVEQMKAGTRPAETDHAVFLRDFAALSNVPDQPYKTAYLALATEYLDRHAGVHQEHRPQYPRISCENYAVRIAEMRRLEKERSDEIGRLKRPDGVITDSARHDELNRLRIDMSWDWKYFTDGAAAMGCDGAAAMRGMN